MFLAFHAETSELTPHKISIITKGYPINTMTKYRVLVIDVDVSGRVHIHVTLSAEFSVHADRDRSDRNDASRNEPCPYCDCNLVAG